MAGMVSAHIHIGETSMNVKYDSLFGLIVTASAFCFAGSGAALAQATSDYVKGTYELVDYCACVNNSSPDPQALLGNVTFDGAGNVSGGGVSNNNGTITSQTLLATYTVTSGGGLTIIGTGGGATVYTGVVSSDGNSIMLMTTETGESPEFIVGARQGAATLLNDSSGTLALVSNTTGTKNAAVGYEALYSNTTGGGNNAQGYQAMFSNTTGSNNSGIGSGALYSSTTGIGNNAVGLTALVGLTTGNRNTAVGNNAGLNLGTGSYNTYIGWGVNGSTGVSVPSENYVTRIGVTYHDNTVAGSPTTYISGIASVPVTGGAPVYVTTTGQLGINGSSERFKTDITALGASTDKLSQLRPVSFHVKSDPTGSVQYGLIAEEVDKVYPELVMRDGDGKIIGVRYDELAPMLLNEVQKQRVMIEALRVQAQRSETQAADIGALQHQVAELNDLKQQLGAALRQVKGGDSFVAQR
jgi:hypothetical protein